MHVDAREENYLVVGSQQHCHCVALQGAGLQMDPLWDSRGSFYLIKSVTTMLIFTLKSVDLSLGVISLSRLETELGVLLTLRCQSPVGLILGSRRKTRRLVWFTGGVNAAAQTRQSAVLKTICSALIS